METEMNTKNNRRRRESVERIEKAFVELLQDRELNELTESDICRKCGLNRSAFGRAEKPGGKAEDRS